MEANSSQFFPLGNRKGLYIWSGLSSSPLPIPLLKLRYVGQGMFLNTRSINVFILLLSWEIVWALVVCVCARGLADLFEVIFYSAFTQMCILLKSGPLPWKHSWLLLDAYAHGRGLRKSMSRKIHRHLNFEILKRIETPGIGFQFCS